MRQIIHSLPSSAAVRRVVALLLAAACVTANAAEAPITRDGLSAEDAGIAGALPRYQQSRAAHFAAWLPDGGMLVTTRFGDTTQLHRLRAPLGLREQVSFLAEGVRASALQPSGDTVALVEPRRGDEVDQLSLLRLTDHTVHALTDGSARDTQPLWAHDGHRLAFTSNRRDGNDVDVYVLDTSTGSDALPRLVVGGSNVRWRLYDWAGDDKHLLLGREAADASEDATDADLYEVDVATGELQPIGAAANLSDDKHERRREKAAKQALPSAARVRRARFAADGHGILALTAQNDDPAAADSEFVHLARLDPADQHWHTINDESAHDIEGFDQSSDGRYIAYLVNDGGSSHLTLVDQQRKLDLAVNQLPPGVISNLKFDPIGQHLALTLESPQAPADVYVLDPQTQLLTRWTESEVGPLDATHFVQPVSLHFPTWDRDGGAQRLLSALVYRSATPASGTSPVLILLCGSGARQCRPDFEPFVQYLVNELGAVVIAPNLRGASGEGRTLQRLGAGELRDDAARDVGSLLVWIGLQKELDSHRVALLGEGPCAYLALQTLSQYGDRLSGAIAANVPRITLSETLTGIRKPLLLAQGLNDPAAPVYQVEQLRSKLRTQSVEVQYLGVGDEGRRFTRRSSLDAYQSATANFLAQLWR